MNKHDQNTFSIEELEQRLEMQKCPDGYVDVLSWIPGVGEGILCYKICGR
jgi:hypothetical protein